MCSTRRRHGRLLGQQRFGQLGDGTTTSRVSRSPSRASRASARSTSAPNTRALLADTTVGCWGCNSVGGLGDGTTRRTGSARPRSRASRGGNAIVTGGSHTCALRADNTVRCWGDERRPGRRRNDDDPSQPGRGPGLSGVTTLAAGSGQLACDAPSSPTPTVGCWGLQQHRPGRRRDHDEPRQPGRGPRPLGRRRTRRRHRPHLRPPRRRQGRMLGLQRLVSSVTGPRRPASSRSQCRASSA